MNLGPAVFYALALAYAALGLGVASASVQFTYEMRHQPRPVWERALDSAVATLGVLTGAGLVLFAAVGAIQGPP